MEEKTKVTAEAGTQEIMITRDFDIGVELLYLAYTEARLLEQWMGNRVIKMDHRDHGSYRFETLDQNNNVVFRANGTIHRAIKNQSIIRTFEMEGMSFPVQLEFLDFEPLDSNTSRLNIKIIFKSPTDRDNLLKLPFAMGINMAHNQLEIKMKNYKKENI